MTVDEENMAMHQLHQSCQEIVMELNVIQREIWAAVYDKRSPNFDKIVLAAVEAKARATTLCAKAEEMRIQGLEMDAGA